MKPTIEVTMTKATIILDLSTINYFVQIYFKTSQNKNIQTVTNKKSLKKYRKDAKKSIVDFHRFSNKNPSCLILNLSLTSIKQRKTSNS